MLKQSFRRMEKYYLWPAIIISLLIAAWLQWPRLQNPYQIEEDFRTLYWVQSYNDPDLFPNEPYHLRGVTRYQIGSWQVAVEDGSPGYSLLFILAGLFITPTLFSKLLIFPLTVISVTYIFRIGEQLQGRGVALVLALVFMVMNLASSTALSIDTGLHRSFAVPFLLAFLYYLMNKRYWAAAAVIFVSGFVYIPVVPVAVITYLLSLIQWRENGRFRPRLTIQPLLPLGIAILLILITLAPLILDRFQFLWTPSPGGGSGESLHILQDPTYRQGGRRPLFSIFPLVGRGGIVKQSIDILHLALMTVFALLTWAVLRDKGNLPAEFRHLFWACWIGFGLSWLVIMLTSTFLLYLPNRHTRYGFFILLLVYIVVNARDALQTAVSRFRAHQQRSVLYVLPIAVIGLGLAFFLPDVAVGEDNFMRGNSVRYLLAGLTAVLVMLAVFNARRKSPPAPPPVKNATFKPRRLGIIVGIVLFLPALPYIKATNSRKYFTPPDLDLSLFTFIETLPKDAVLGGDPCSLNSVSFYGKRTVLFSCERFTYLEDVDTAVTDALRAYYAESPETVAAFCRDYGIDYLVVNTDRFPPNRSPDDTYFYEPYHSRLAPEFQGRMQFALNNVPAASMLFQEGKYFVIPCQLDAISGR